MFFKTQEHHKNTTPQTKTRN